MTIILYITFGLLPSLIWLLFYLKKDKLPESKRMVIRVFFFGMIAAVCAAIIEIAISRLFLQTRTSEEFAMVYPIAAFLIYHFLLVSFVEELSKFFTVKMAVLKHPEFDEPVDAMIYMIVSALGFAALENLLYILPLIIPGGEMSLYQAGAISFFRFAGATFLHALCSGTIGFFLALSIFRRKHRFSLLVLGMITAIILHGLFNISIIGIEEGILRQNGLLLKGSVTFLIGLLALMAATVSLEFRKLKRIASVCKI